ncbi:MAG: hypothetical protein K2R98_28570 [Gemmataceae bacterium]|nr:hypothetical protein [Gemmataceae bacterium]
MPRSIRIPTLAAILGLAALTTLAEGQPGGPKWEALNNKATGNFIVALAQDLQGNVWVGTEDKGVFRYEPKASEGKQWTQFTRKDGLGDDNAYAIAVDKLGRVWVGTLNHGVSVWSGANWKNYDVLDGPIGERIFAIATCPTDGDVWMATSAGLTRHSLEKETWTHFTRADGLPEDQASALAFDAQGNLYVGTHSHGIAFAKASDDYKKWTVQTGPVPLPVIPNGAGLPSALINALLVARDGTVYAGTTAGLAWSKDKGKTWAYLRGRDYAPKVKDRWGGAPPGWKEAPKEVLDALLPEDYVTCLAEDDAGLLWLGFRQKGCLALDAKTRRQVFAGTKKAEGLPDDFVSAVLPTADFRPFVGTYGGGLGRAKEALKPAGAKPLPVPKGRLPDGWMCPEPAATATLGEFDKLIQAVEKVPVAKAPAGPAAHFVVDDWRTRGDFYGEDKFQDYRYSEGFAVLCAHSSPEDAVWGGNSVLDRLSFGCYGRTGSHATKDEALRHWVHWKTTDDPRVLKDPFGGRRRQSEWDDHKEAYALTHEGPGLYIDLHVPRGTWYLSFYFMNKDGHDANNRWRDYVLTIKPQSKTDTDFARAPTLARTRVRDFWGGVYKTFVVAGDRKYTAQIHPNWSFNTIVSGVFLDPVIDPPKAKDLKYLLLETPYPRVRYTFSTEEADGLRKFWTKPPKLAAQGALSALGALEQRRYKDPLGWPVDARRHYLTVERVLMKENKPSGMWTEIWDRAQAEGANQLRLFDLRDKIYKDSHLPVIPLPSRILDRDTDDK